MSGDWRELLAEALDILRQAEVRFQRPIHWTLGGGTALMLHVDHRESYDIDLFIDDPQALPFLNPIIQEMELQRQPSGYRTDGARSLKIAFDNSGEIDFICSGCLTEPGFISTVLEGTNLALETPEEIIAKKILYRGSSMQPRDMFDIAAAVQHLEEDALVEALLPFAEASVGALVAAERMNPSLARNIIGQLVVRQPFKVLQDSAQEVTVAFLRKVVTASTAGWYPAPG